MAVTAEDIRRVADTYFHPDNRSVAVFRRKDNAEPVDPELAALDPQHQMMIRHALAEIEKYGPDELEMVLAQMQAQSASVPPDFKDGFDYLLKKVRQRLDGLRAAEDAGADAND